MKNSFKTSLMERVKYDVRNSIRCHDAVNNSVRYTIGNYIWGLGTNVLFCFHLDIGEN